jgi:polygalacturonase
MKAKFYCIKAVLLMAAISFQFAKGQSSFPQNTFNVKQYGAVGDGKTLDNKAINKAIDAASAAGGGTVFIPAGNYLSGSIRLKSNISLYLDQGAVIIAAPVSAENGYDEEEPGPNNAYQDSGHSHWHNSLIWGENLHDISILGQGEIWGENLYHDYAKGKQTANKSIALLLCRNVNISDITFLHAGWFAILATGVDNLTISNVKMDTNRDGMDIDCCRDVHISNCSVNTPNDDGICLKSSFALGFARATENVTITNCTVSGYTEGSLLDGTFKKTGSNGIGRIKLGTESNGGFKNITISNCVFNYCHGLALETVDGGLLEDVTITNITMRDIFTAAIFLRLGSRMRGPDSAKIGDLRRVIISNIVAYNVSSKQGVLISGIPGHDIKDVEISNVKLYLNGGGTAEQAAQAVPELEKGYPEPDRFGTLPAYGVYARHVSGLKLADIDLLLMHTDARPAVMLENVTSAELRFVRADSSTTPMVQKSSGDIALFHSLNMPDSQKN